MKISSQFSQHRSNMYGVYAKGYQSDEPYELYGQFETYKQALAFASEYDPYKAIVRVIDPQGNEMWSN